MGDDGANVRRFQVKERPSKRRKNALTAWRDTQEKHRGSVHQVSLSALTGEWYRLIMTVARGRGVNGD